jgi:hypothetical protein
MSGRVIADCAVDVQAIMTELGITRASGQDHVAVYSHDHSVHRQPGQCRDPAGLPV